MTGFSSALAGVALLSTVAAEAQTVPAAPVPDRVYPLPAQPKAPPLEAMLRPPTARPPGPPPFNPPAPPLVLAIEAAQATLAACAAEGLNIGVAVTDSAGQLIVGIEADAANPGRIYMATMKDLSAVAFKLPTSQIQAKLRADPSLWPEVKPNMVVGPGAVPLFSKGELIGAIGASGAKALQDEACAAAGAAQIQARL